MSTPWLDNARADLGVHEIKGKKHNERILEMLREIGHPEVQNDEDAWCATALGSWLVRAGKPTSKPVKLNRSGLSYEDYGTPCEPKTGAISVSTYTKAGKKDWRRHVGIITEVTPTRLNVLGGNTKDQVTETWINRNNVTAVRWPPAVAVPDVLQAPKGMAQTAAKSPTVQMGVGSIFMLVFGYIGDGFGWLFHSMLGLLQYAPTNIAAVSPLVYQSQEMAGWLNIPWAKISVGVVVLLIGGMIVRHVWDSRWLNKGETS